MADLVSNPMNDVGPETARSEEPREELEEEEQRDWVTLSAVAPLFARVGQWLSAADGAPTPLAWALYAVT